MITKSNHWHHTRPQKSFNEVVRKENIEQAKCAMLRPGRLSNREPCSLSDTLTAPDEIIVASETPNPIVLLCSGWELDVTSSALLPN
jgi:hypothetical protein